ncbi:MAG: tetratricopeptide repeat protein [Stellaceae bacterium]
MSELFREIDEELRRENFARLWKRFGLYIIGVVVAALLGAGIYVAWRGYEARQRAAEGEQFQVAMNLLHAGKLKGAASAFEELAQSGHERAVLARLEAAAIATRQGDTAAAIRRYDGVAADDTIDPAFRDLATILAAQDSLAKGNPHRIINQLQPLAEGSGPWQPSALELTALAQLKAGDRKAAYATYRHLADDLAAPPGMRSRAAEMVAVLAP